MAIKLHWLAWFSKPSKIKMWEVEAMGIRTIYWLDFAWLGIDITIEGKH
jgi:hypothetical protein